MSAHRLLKDLFLDNNGADIPHPGDAESITVDRQLGFVALVSAGAETRTLPNPEKAGIILLVYAKTAAGTITLTVTNGYNDAGDTALALANAGECALLVSVEDGDNIRWRLVTSPALTQSAALTAADGGTVDATYGQDEADVIANLVTRQGEIEAALVAAGIVAEA